MQNATQSPSVFRRSSWIQFRLGLPTAGHCKVAADPADVGDDCMAVREAEPVSSLQEVKEVGLDRDDLLGIYRNMLITRGIEERGLILYKQGNIPGSFCTGRGNEGATVGVGTAMGPGDVGTPLHRVMGV